MHVNKSERKLLPMSRIAPGRNDAAEIDTVVSAKRYGDRRAFDILMEAQYYWSQMDDFGKTGSETNAIPMVSNGTI